MPQSAPWRTLSACRVDTHGDALSWGQDFILQPSFSRLGQAGVPFGPACPITIHAKSWTRIGRRRMRLPVAAKSALATAGAMPGVLASPIPPGGFWLGTM